MNKRHIAMGAALAALVSACATPSEVATDRVSPRGETQSKTDGSQASAVTRLAGAVSALGGAAALEAARSFRAEQNGTYYAFEQAQNPSEIEAAVDRSYRWQFDVNRVVVREAEQVFPGAIRFLNRAALTAEGGWTVDLLKWRSGTDLVTVGAAEALRNSTQSERFFPHLLLQQARQAEVVTLSDQGFRYKDASGQLIEVRLDPATNRPLSAAMIVEDRRQTEWTYLDYQPRHGIQLPLRTEVRQAGRLQERLQLGATDLGRADPALLQPPSEYTAPPAGAPPALREAAPGVFFFEGMLGGYSSMAIETNDYFVIFEAPSGAEYAALQKRLLGERRPGKEVKYVLVTHHHGDHTGGVKAWHDLGATIVVAAGATPALERQLRARGGTGDFRIEEVGAHRRFGSGANAIDTYAFSNAHAASNLLMHLPGHRILFQGDMYAAPVRGPLPAATPLARVLAQQIAQRKLNVSLIVAVHGRPVTMAELRTAISMPTASPAS